MRTAAVEEAQRELEENLRALARSEHVRRRREGAATLSERRLTLLRLIHVKHLVRLLPRLKQCSLSPGGVPLERVVSQPRRLCKLPGDCLRQVLRGCREVLHGAADPLRR